MNHSGPIKRSEAIAPLSRDHHGALVFAQRIGKLAGDDELRDKLQIYIAWFWENHLQPHFREEEEILFPEYDGEGIQQALKEHATIQELVSQIALKAETAPITALGDALREHVRFEERILFPDIEKALEPEAMSRVEEALKEHATCPTYPEPFW